MSNIEKYNLAFIETFSVREDELQNLSYKGVVAWDSVGHMSLVAALEETFDIMMDTEDIIEFKSYKKGKEILSKEEYGVKFDE